MGQGKLGLLSPPVLIYISASCSEQVEEAVLDPAPGHPHLHRLWRSPGQVQVSLLTHCPPPLVPLLHAWAFPRETKRD